jgi:hypothetical protein
MSASTQRRRANGRLRSAPLGLAVSKNQPLKPKWAWHFASAMLFCRGPCFIRVREAALSNVPRFSTGANTTADSASSPPLCPPSRPASTVASVVRVFAVILRQVLGAAAAVAKERVRPPDLYQRQLLAIAPPLEHADPQCLKESP